MKTISEHKKAIIVIAGIIAAIMLVFYLNRSNGYVTRIIRNMTQQQQTQINNDYQTQLAQSKKERAALMDEIAAAEKKIKTLAQKIQKIDGDIHANRKPESSNELRDRFRALGFNPVE